MESSQGKRDLLWRFGRYESRASTISLRGKIPCFSIVSSDCFTRLINLFSALVFQLSNSSSVTWRARLVAQNVSGLEWDRHDRKVWFERYLLKFDAVWIQQTYFKPHIFITNFAHNSYTKKLKILTENIPEWYHTDIQEAQLAKN